MSESKRLIKHRGMIPDLLIGRKQPGTDVIGGNVEWHCTTLVNCCTWAVREGPTTVTAESLHYHRLPALLEDLNLPSMGKTRGQEARNN